MTRDLDISFIKVRLGIIFPDLKFNIFMKIGKENNIHFRTWFKNSRIDFEVYPERTHIVLNKAVARIKKIHPDLSCTVQDDPNDISEKQNFRFDAYKEEIEQRIRDLNRALKNSEAYSALVEIKSIPMEGKNHPFMSVEVKQLPAIEPPVHSLEDIMLWPDGGWCCRESLHEFMSDRSDDYQTLLLGSEEYNLFCKENDLI